MKDNIHI